MQMITNIGQNATELEQIIGVVALVSGGLVGLANVGVSFVSIMSSYSIEIALMTKKEQWKHKLLSLLVLMVAMWISNVIYGYLCRANSEFCVLFVVAGLLAFVALVAVLSLFFLNWLFNILNNIQICRVLCFVIVKIAKKIWNLLHDVTVALREIISKLIMKICSRGLFKWLYLNINKMTLCVQEIWIRCEKEKVNNHINKLQKKDILELIAYSCVWILGFMFNCAASVYEKENYNIFVGSTLVTILSFEISTIFVQLGIRPGEAKIYYYDAEYNKDINVFYRYNDEYCICGDASKILDCKEYFLISYEKIMGIPLMPVYRRESKLPQIDYKRVLLQSGGNEFVVEEVLNKVKNELESQNITRDELNQVNIYIKPSEGKVFYVVSDDISGEVDL